MNPTIALIESAQSDKRIRVSLKSTGGGLQLLSESFSADVGWYVQSSMDLEPEQVAALRGLLGAHTGKGKSGGDTRMAPPPSLTIHRAG